jgi:hypothetical protein
MGVSPTSSVIFSATRRRVLDETGTLQVTEAAKGGQCDSRQPSAVSIQLCRTGVDGDVAITSQSLTFKKWTAAAMGITDR